MTILSRLIAAALFTLGSAAATAGTGYVYLQPSPTKCANGAVSCAAQKAAIQTPPTAVPQDPQEPTDETPPASTDPDVVAQAEQHIDQAFDIALYTGGSLSYLDSLGTDVWALMGMYSASASQGTPTYTRDSQNRVVSSTQVGTVSASRGGLSTSVCNTIASKRLAGITCGGGTISVSIRIRIDQSWVEANGSVRDYQTQQPVSHSNTWLTATPSQVAGATPNAPGYAIVQGL